MNIKNACKNDSTMKALTDIIIVEFDSLLLTFTEFLLENN
jgi:hypothetical protein